jgi:hypothetical protein
MSTKFDEFEPLKLAQEEVGSENKCNHCSFIGRSIRSN